MQKIAEHLILPDLLLRENTQYQRMHIYLRQREKIKKKKKRRSTLLSSVVHGKANHLRKKNSKPQHFRPCGVSLTRQGMVQRE